MKDIDKEPDKIPTFHHDDDFGEWLHDLLMKEFGLETREWALEKVRRAQNRLQSGRPESDRYITEVLWLPDPTAFTAPGRYVYISRELLQRLPSEEEVALVIGHEISHHDLGHIYTFHGKSIWHRLPVHAVLTGLMYHARRLANSPRYESEADANGLKMCAEAGYDPQKCMVAFDILEMLMLDLNQIDVAFGPEDVPEEPAPGLLGRLRAEFQHWKWEHKLGYASLRDRKEALQATLQSGLCAGSSADTSEPIADDATRKVRGGRLARFDARLERWHFGIVGVVAVVTEVMRSPAYRLVTGRDGPNTQDPYAVMSDRARSVVSRFETVRHQLYLLMALLGHVDAARQNIHTETPDEKTMASLESLLAHESATLEDVDGGHALRELFGRQDALESDSLQRLMDDMARTAEETREVLVELDT